MSNRLEGEVECAALSPDAAGAAWMMGQRVGIVTDEYNPSKRAKGLAK